MVRLVLALCLLAACRDGFTEPPGYYPRPPQSPPPAPRAPGSGAQQPPPGPADPELPIPPDRPMPQGSYSTTVAAKLGAPVKGIVDGRADIFSAGLDRTDPHRAGVLPAVVLLPAGGSRAVSFAHVAGRVGCSAGAAQAGPDGGTCAGGSTDLQSTATISGIVDHEATQFLVGVFLAGAPTARAPRKLDFGKRGLTQEFRALRPELAQTFFIGDGQAEGSPQIFFVPDGATLLALGIADGFSFQGEPGAYGDNTGGFAVTLTVDTMK